MDLFDGVEQPPPHIFLLTWLSSSASPMARAKNAMGDGIS